MHTKDPVQDCIVSMRTNIQHYLQDNAKRNNEEVSCFQLRSFVRGGYDTALAQSKKKLADDVDYTLEHIGTTYRNEIARIGRDIPTESDRAQLSYNEIIKNFARIKDCIDAAIINERNEHSWRAGAGKLIQALNLSQRAFETYWAQTKEQIWNMKPLHGVKFEFSQFHQPAVFARFDKELDIHRGQFTAIMFRPETMETYGITPPGYEPPPAYASSSNAAGIGANPFVEIDLGEKGKVTIRH
jgi:hypothetical protein